eukprot:892620-Pleurochrysis_carterae.AAC.1
MPSGMTEEDIIASMKLYAEQACKRKERARKKTPAAGVCNSSLTDGYSAAVADGEDKENPPENTQEIGSTGERGL